MFSRMKITTVSGLLVGLAMTCVGVAQADDVNPSGCVMDDQGNVICTHKSQIDYTSPDGREVIQQTQNCSTTFRQPRGGVWPAIGVLQSATTATNQPGLALNCNNTEPQR